MNFNLRTTTRLLWVATRVTVICTLVLGVLYPLVITGIGAVAFPSQANGSMVTTRDGRVVGSALLGQSFSDASGAPLTQYFQPRPSMAGDGYDGGGSGGSNWGPENAELIAAITQRRAEVAAFNGVPESQVPVDALTASASGLDPDISPAYARLQAARVAQARGLPVDRVLDLVEASTRTATPAYLGPARVNVLELNLALDELGR